MVRNVNILGIRDSYKDNDCLRFVDDNTCFGMYAGMTLETKFNVRHCHTMWYLMLGRTFAMGPPLN